jgi:hypothetical protein
MKKRQVKLIGLGLMIASGIGLKYSCDDSTYGKYMSSQHNKGTF